ncbi:hypothetical protein Hamer_G011899 [Homarus americanus]|uniref:Uncharacterized protein n=2 Tax=Homarus americanus TaxID=6706 RepID=A0A8J5JYJ9_HOMAM|nr:hypothetical protein Hamer_G011899 [Homarus americanus]
MFAVAMFSLLVGAAILLSVVVRSGREGETDYITPTVYGVPVPRYDEIVSMVSRFLDTPADQYE